MRYAIISDIHANVEALTATLRDMEATKVDHLICLGDFVGYGPEPNEVIEMLQPRLRCAVAGNHDFAALGWTDTTYFNPHALAAILWTKNSLTATSKEYLSKLPLSLVDHNMTLVHATPREPGEWHYLFTLDDAQENFSYFQTSLCFIGHSHYPLIAVQSDGGKVNAHTNAFQAITHRCRYLINVGSVGQPRDGNPQASYVIYDTAQEGVWFRRVSYDIPGVQRKMCQQGLPTYLRQRLQWGN